MCCHHRLDTSADVAAERPSFPLHTMFDSDSDLVLENGNGSRLAPPSTVSGLPSRVLVGQSIDGTGAEAATVPTVSTLT